jgi:hypothetical protein
MRTSLALAATRIRKTPEIESSKRPTPANEARSASEPGASSTVRHAARPARIATDSQPAMVLAPSVKDTVPPCGVGLTTALSVTRSPVTSRRGDTEMLTLVATGPSEPPDPPAEPPDPPGPPPEGAGALTIVSAIELPHVELALRLF